MARKITQKQLKHDEFVDAAFDLGHWFEEHFASVALGVAGAIVLTLAIVGGVVWSKSRAEKQGEALAQAIDLYSQAESGGFADPRQLATVLEALERAAPSSGRSEALARFYLGSTQFRLGRFDEARTQFEAALATAGVGETVGATAQIMLARLHVAAGRPEEGIRLLEALATAAAAAIPRDQALLELGRLHEASGRPDLAREEWQRVIAEYPSTPSAEAARSLVE